MPADFAPVIVQERVRGGLVWVWRDTLTINSIPVQMEYALRHDDMGALRQRIWEIHEHARAGRHAMRRQD